MKHWSTKLIIVLLLAGVFLSGYNYFHRPFLKRFEGLVGTEPTEEVVLYDPVQIAVDSLSAEEKIFQLVSYPVVLSAPESSVAAEVAWIAEHQPGLVTIFGSNISAEAATDFSKKMASSSAEYAPLIAVDHEGGTVQRLRGEGFSVLPSWRQQCQMEQGERQELLAESATQLAQAGVNIVFAPVLDVARAGSFLGSRACVDSDEVVVASEDFITRFAEQRILPVIKHYPGIGSSVRDLHFLSDTITLQSEDTAPFTATLDAFPNLGVMTSHAIIQDRTDGQPCSLSASCLAPFSTYFPDVLLFSDALEMVSAGLAEGNEVSKPLAERAELALRAGNHILVFGESVSPTAIEALVSELAIVYENDEQFAQQVDAAVTRVILLKEPAGGGIRATE